jgi:uncharacterized protein YjbJ (UPF0337 family)
MNRDEIAGKKENFKGRVKQATGVLTGNDELESEGKDERSEGALREKGGRLRRKVGESIEDFGKNLKR